MRWDVVIVGAGVVGLACARALALAASGRTVLVIERHARAGQETSSRNSGVLHAGIYYPTGSLKAQLCLRGNRALYEYCRRRDVPHAAIGKFIVATSDDEEARLEELLARAHANGAVEVERAALSRLEREEPNVRARAALWSPRTGVVDAVALMRALAADAQADFVWKSALAGARRDGGEWLLTTSDGEELRAGRVINAAGLDAGEVAALGGFEHSQYFVKGNYFRLRSAPTRHLVYPLPERGGVGIHVTLDLDGSARLGPDVEPVEPGARRDFSVDESRRERFFAAASRYLPNLSIDDLSPDQAGVRPKVEGGDFIIDEQEGWTNLVGIESPGLTSCLAIADRVVGGV